MNKLIPVIAIALFTSCVFAQKVEVKTVSSVDLTKYVGTWYEVATIPQSFQKDCVKNTKANYKALSANKIDVINTCTAAEGKTKVANGRAKVEDTVSNAKLQVSFVKLFGGYIFPFGGEYWIIDLATDYSYALIGNPSQKYAWILTRTPNVSIQTLERASKMLKQNGYNTCDIITSVQDGGNQKKQPLCDVVK